MSVLKQLPCLLCSYAGILLLMKWKLTIENVYIHVYIFKIGFLSVILSAGDYINF